MSIIWRPWESNQEPSTSANLCPPEASISTTKRHGLSRHGSTVVAQAQKIILHIKEICQQEKDHGSLMKPLSNVVERVAFLCGISPRTVRNIVQRKKKNGGEVVTPGTKRPRPKFAKVDQFDRGVIRRIMHQQFKANTVVTLQSLLAIVRQDLAFPYGLKTLWSILRQMGFKFKKRGNRLRVLERREIVSWRTKYIRKITAKRAANTRILYQGETWVNQGYTTGFAWYDETVEKDPFSALVPGSDLSLGYKDPSGRGQRLIISHIGGSDGFIPAASEVFRSKKTSDYHEEMNGERWESWFEKLCSTQPHGTVIVIDNASYHSAVKNRAPTCSSTKKAMKAWLEENSIAYDSKAKKEELYQKFVEPVKDQYQIPNAEKIAAKYGCEILRLPPYHSELNPIELIWALVKGRIAKRNSTFKLADVEKLVNEELQRVTSTDWQKAISHVIGIEKKYFKMIPNAIDPVIVTVQSDESSDDE